MNVQLPPPLRAPFAAGGFGHARGRPLAFLHIPKTAGTAFGAALSQRFALSDTLAGLRLGMTAGASHPLLAEGARLAKLLGVGAHLDRDKLDAIAAALPDGEAPFIVTLLREPRARLISQYRHWRRSVDSSLATVPAAHREAFLAAREMPLGEFLAARIPFVERHFRNLQCCMLAGMATAEMLDEAALLDTARASLAEIDVVGTTDAVDEALARVADAYGWTAPDRVGRLNVAANPIPPFDDGTEALIEEFTRADAALWRDLGGEEAAPAPVRARSFFRPGRALLATLLDGGGTRFTMADALQGRGWHVREGVSPLARWTGPGRVSEIRLPAPAARQVELSVQLVSVLDWAVMDGIALTLDGVAPTGPPEVLHGGELPLLFARFDLADAGDGTRELRIEVPFTRSHAELDPEVRDDRQKGVAIGDIMLTPLAAAPPPTLGALFWHGEAWSDAAPETLVELLDIARDGAATPPAERHLAFDLPLLAAILDRIAPDHVWAAARETPLAMLERGTPGALPAEGRLAIVGTLFELPARGTAIATLAARHEEAVLLLACAEDHRLRALLANPLLAPHVHLVGCTNAILVANLAAMRRSGGAALVDGFLLLMERIVGTTPERIGAIQRDVGQRFVLRLLAQTMELLEGLAAGRRMDADMLRPLLPEQGGGAATLEQARFRARFAALRREPASPLALVEPALMDSIATLLDLLVQGGIESDSGWNAALVAHDRLFRLCGVLAGWERFGLADNATAQLARKLRNGRAAPAILPKPLKPFGEYIDFYRAEARQMARSGVAPGIRLDLATLGGGLDHVVRLNQAAREVELALRLLAKRFPEEEILWVDAGCSYGVLLNTVEVPPALAGRCRFLGFDFNAPGIAVARAAAANAGRTHCRFEVGDVAQARELAGGRIHLVTAFEVLEHCPDPLAVLREYRAMEPGMLIAGSPLNEPQGVLPAEQHLWCFDADGYAALVSEAGFAPVGVNRREVGRFVGGHDWVTVTATTGDPAALAIV